MAELILRRAVRALVLDEDDRVLLCRLDMTAAGGLVVWVAPGGGVESGESPLAALRRELDEEIGLRLEQDPPWVWHQTVVGPRHAPGYDGIINDYYLVRTPRFVPRGAWPDEVLAAENITRFQWWTLAEIESYHGIELFSPRDLAGPLRILLSSGIPAEPVALGV